MEKSAKHVRVTAERLKALEDLEAEALNAHHQLNQYNAGLIGQRLSERIIKLHVSCLDEVITRDREIKNFRQTFSPQQFFVLISELVISQNFTPRAKDLFLRLNPSQAILLAHLENRIQGLRQVMHALETSTTYNG